ncbi:YggT family protein [Leucobacter sp. HY1910]
MEVVFAIGTVLRLAIRLFIIVLWARLIIDWVMIFSRNFRPRGAVAVLVELVYSATDPPIKMFRKLLPPIRLGQVSIDLGWILTLVSCWILLAIIPGFA